MKAEYLNLDDLLDVSEGYLHIHGRRSVLHQTHAFAQFRKDLVQMVGAGQAKRILTRYGFFWGQADAAAMKRIFKWENPIELLKAGPRLHALSGIGKTVIKSLEISQSSDAFHMEVYLHDSCEAEEQLTSMGKSGSPSCWKLIGYMSGYASFAMGRSIYFIEKQCQAQGDGFCSAIGKDVASWGDEITEHLKYFEADDIKGNVERLTEELKRKTAELARHRQRLRLMHWSQDPAFAEVRSNAYKRVIELAGRVAQFDSSLLVTGETGVGKEVLARYIHRHSHRAKEPFVVVNCAALPETLLESELFGHKAGSFTGATRDRIGLLEQATSGTILVDEIGDISPGTQLKILRVLQEKEITRVGESEPRQIDVRVIAATHRNLAQLVTEGKFREDLLYRLRVIEIEVPPLRERPEDILPIAKFIITRLSRKLGIPELKLDVSSLDYLQAYSWPGNVREMENAIERAAVLNNDGLILPENLPPEIIRQATTRPRISDPLSCSLAQAEREHILAVLKLTGDNRTKAARALGVSPSTLWRKLKEMESDSSET